LTWVLQYGGGDEEGGYKSGSFLKKIGENLAKKRK
jgi:hypothetical protein